MIKFHFLFYFFVLGFVACGKKSQVPATIEQADERVLIKGGKFMMGDEQTQDARPLVEQQIPDFWMNKYEVTQIQFEAFVAATNYKTLAEKNGGSYVFVQNFVEDSFSLSGAPWWRYRKYASWRNPRGDKNLATVDAFSPVTHIAYEDACAYCAWKNMRLPSEAEWEYAAQTNGDVSKKNIWQGNFPYKNTEKDGFYNTSPVGTFPAGKNGLYDMGGNVWEWCSDYYNANWYRQANEISKSERINGPSSPYDPTSPYDTSRVIRGGSYLCAENYCRGYQAFSRMRSDVKMTFGHIGFRCVKSK